MARSVTVGAWRDVPDWIKAVFKNAECGQSSMVVHQIQDDLMSNIVYDMLIGALANSYKTNKQIFKVVTHESDWHRITLFDIGPPEDGPVKRYRGILTTIELSPAYSANFEVDAQSVSEAENKALDLDFDLLEWSDDRGNVRPWDELDSLVAVAAGTETL
jgi:hypothetical protein